jgi:hypothetical protein
MTTFQYIRKKQDRTTESRNIKKIQPSTEFNESIPQKDGLFCCTVPQAQNFTPPDK